MASRIGWRPTTLTKPGPSNRISRIWSPRERAPTPGVRTPNFGCDRTEVGARSGVAILSLNPLTCTRRVAQDPARRSGLNPATYTVRGRVRTLTALRSPRRPGGSAPSTALRVKFHSGSGREKFLSGSEDHPIAVFSSLQPEQNDDQQEQPRVVDHHPLLAAGRHPSGPSPTSTGPRSARSLQIGRCKSFPVVRITTSSIGRCQSIGTTSVIGTSRISTGISTAVGPG